MRTVLELNDDLVSQAKNLAAQEHTTLNGLIEDALKRYLQMLSSKHSTVNLPVFHGEGGLAATVADTLTNRALLDAADADMENNL